MSVAVGLSPGAEGANSLKELPCEGCRVGLPEIHGDLRERQHPPARIGGPADDYRIAEVALVMDPVEMHAQRRRQLRIENAVLDHRHHAAGHERAEIAFGLTDRRTLGFSGSDVVDVNDHLGGGSLPCDPEAPAATL